MSFSAGASASAAAPVTTAVAIDDSSIGAVTLFGTCRPGLASSLSAFRDLATLCDAGTAGA